MPTQTSATRPATRPCDRRTWRRQVGQQHAVYRWECRHRTSSTCLVLVHGFGEYMDRFDRVIEAFDHLPLTIVGYDHRGHGRSDGARGDADGLDQLADDFQAILPFLLEQAAADSCVVLAHSMGAATLAKLLTRGVTPKPIRAAVLSAPSLEIPRTPIVQIKIVVGRLIARVLPTLTVDAGVNPAAISHDPDRVRAYREDPMVLRKISARLGKSLIDDTDAIIASASRISIPLLVYHGTDDAIASIGGTRRFVQNAPANLVEYREAEGFFHEVHNERRDWAAPFMTGVADWIAQQAGLHPLTADAKSVDG